MKRADEILNTFLRKKGIKLAAGSSFFDTWEEIAGEKIASQSEIRDIKNNTLIVEVYHPGCSQLLNMQQKVLLKKIHRLYPELGIEKIHPVLAKKRPDKDGSQKRAGGSREKKEGRTAGKETAAPHEDIDLEDALERLKQSVYKASGIDKTD
jgi:hypothetical protein